MASYKITMRKIFSYAKFVIGLIVILVFYNKIFLIHRTDVMDSNDESMIPTLHPRDRFWFRITEEEKRADAMRKRELVVYRRPHKPGSWRVGRVMGLPGETVEGRTIPRGYLWIASDTRKKEHRFAELVHEHFIIGKLHGVKLLPRDEGKI